jgi:hypothetical protein
MFLSSLFFERIFLMDCLEVIRGQQKPEVKFEEDKSAKQKSELKKSR